MQRTNRGEMSHCSRQHVIEPPSVGLLFGPLRFRGTAASHTLDQT